jgi:hypothetical protein
MRTWGVQSVINVQIPGEGEAKNEGMWAWRAYARRRRSAKVQLRAADLLAGWLVLIWVWGSWGKGGESSLSPCLRGGYHRVPDRGLIQ